MEPFCTSVGWHPSSCNLWLSRFLFFYWCFSIELLGSWLAWMLVFCLFLVLTGVMYSINSTFSVPVLLPNNLVHLGNIQMQDSFSCFSISKVGLESIGGIGTRYYTLLHHMHKSLNLCLNLCLNQENWDFYWWEILKIHELISTALFFQVWTFTLEVPSK